MNCKNYYVKKIRSGSDRVRMRNAHRGTITEKPTYGTRQLRHTKDNLSFLDQIQYSQDHRPAAVLWILITLMLIRMQIRIQIFILCGSGILFEKVLK